MSCTESLGLESFDERTVDDDDNQNIEHLNDIFSLKPTRIDGRLELNEVKIDPSQILFVSRQEGRLRLNLILDQEEEDEENDNDNDNDDEDVVINAIQENDEETVNENKEMKLPTESNNLSIS
ncbi:uncharacterized protein LOC129875759 [Solanum dulcamara]|uniref:uncharacterized protein LOC129875759 n=1 Tax=Solanum dulcamara TaxID=45834 RepID=UPI002485E326|nr:uncharacterized protein LOC129875759 [Solanum dulcamara]